MSARRMVRVTWDSPLAFGGDVTTVPDTEVWNGAAGIPEVADAAEEGEWFVCVVAPEYEVAAEPDNWARSAEDVPARWDQPGAAVQRRRRR